MRERGKCIAVLLTDLLKPLIPQIARCHLYGDFHIPGVFPGIKIDGVKRSPKLPRQLLRELLVRIRFVAPQLKITMRYAKIEAGRFEQMCHQHRIHTAAYGGQDVIVMAEKIVLSDEMIEPFGGQHHQNY
jgi:hypothetical protein